MFAIFINVSGSTTFNYACVIYYYVTFRFLYFLLYYLVSIELLHKYLDKYVHLIYLEYNEIINMYISQHQSHISKHVGRRTVPCETLPPTATET